MEYGKASMLCLKLELQDSDNPTRIPWFIYKLGILVCLSRICFTGTFSLFLPGSSRICIPHMALSTVPSSVYPAFS